MRLNLQDLGKIADLTLEHYDRRAEDFWEGTRDHDVSQNIDALLRYIEGDPSFAILDFGRGPGRDLKAFAELGHIAVGLEGAARLAVMARAHSDGEVWQQDFLKLDLPERRFDGVFANGHNEEGWNRGRYGVYHDLENWRRYMSAGSPS